MYGQISYDIFMNGFLCTVSNYNGFKMGTPDGKGCQLSFPLYMWQL